MATENYFKCAGCGRFVSYSQINEHYNSNHQKGIAVETPPAPATVANPPPMPTYHGIVLQPIVKMETGDLLIDIRHMRRSHPKTFWVWTGVVFAAVSMLISTIFAWIIVFHI